MKIEKKDRKKSDRAYISPSMRQLIIAESLKMPRIPRTTLANNLLSTFKNQYGEDAPLPTEETLEKLISKARNYKTKAWHLGLMRQYCTDISPDAVPYILAVQAWMDKQGWAIERKDWGGEEVFLTVKQAQWIARLFRIIKSFDDEEIAHLYRVSHWYTVYEIMHEISKKDDDEFNTSDIDKALRNNKMQELYENEIIDAINGKSNFLDASSSLRNIDDADRAIAQQHIYRHITKIYLDRLVESGKITQDEAELIKSDTKALDIIIQESLKTEDGE